MFEINPEFVPLKLIYFFFYSSASCLMSYKSIFQKSLGMSPAQNGILQSTERFLILCFPPIIGALADINSHHKLLLTTSLIMFSTLLFPAYFIPPVDKITVPSEEYLCFNSTSSNIICNQTSTDHNNCYIGNNYYYNCSSSIQNVSNISSDSTIKIGSCSNITKCLFNRSIDNTDKYGLTFTLLMVFTIVYALISSPIGPLLDATTFQILAQIGHQTYGRQRMFGSIGYGVGALAIGFLTDFYSQHLGIQGRDYLFVFVGMTFLGLIATIISTKLEVPHHEIASILPGLRLIFTSLHIALFVWVIFIHGVVQSVKYTFLFWYGESLPGGGPTVFGLATLSDCLSEVPMFFISDWIIKKIGHKSSLFLGLLFASFRTLMYAYLSHAWQMVLLEATNGFAFALPMAAMCSNVYKVAPDGMTTTLMSLVQGVYWGLANVFGSFLGGILYEKYGALLTFKLTAGLGAIGAFIYYFLAICTQKCKSTTENIQIAEISEMEKFQAEGSLSNHS